MIKHWIRSILSAPRWLAAGTSFLAILLTAVSCVTKENAAEQWLEFVEKPVVQKINIVGHIESANIDTVTAPFESLIEEKYFTEGQRVAKGEILIRFDTSQLELQRRESLANLLKARRVVRDLEGWHQGAEMMRGKHAVSLAKLTLLDTERKLKEARKLYERGIVPRMEVESLEQQVQTQGLDLSVAESDLRLIQDRGAGENREIAEMERINAQRRFETFEVQGKKRVFISPFTGSIVRAPGQNADKTTEPIQKGSRVMPGQMLFGIASLEKLKSVGKVDEIDINRLREGMKVDITGDGFEPLRFSGEIISLGGPGISPDASGPNYEIVVDFPEITEEQRQQLRLGMSTKMSITRYRNEAAIVLPPHCLSRNEGKTFVFYKHKESAPEERIDVRTGQSLPEGVEIFGLRPGRVRC